MVTRHSVGEHQLDRIESSFYTHMYGDYESATRPLWIYGHVAILLATALVGYAVARGRFLTAALLVPFPAVYLYKRYEKARTTRSDRTRRSSHSPHGAPRRSRGSDSE